MKICSCYVLYFGLMMAHWAEKCRWIFNLQYWLPIYVVFIDGLNYYNKLIIVSVVGISMDLKLGSVLLLWSKTRHDKLCWQNSIFLSIFFFFVSFPVLSSTVKQLHFAERRGCNVCECGGCVELGHLAITALCFCPVHKDPELEFSQKRAIALTHKRFDRMRSVVLSRTLHC